MKRRAFLKSSLLAGAGVGFNHSAQSAASLNEQNKEQKEMKKKPHVIFIMTDQHRGDALGCMGNKAVISPNLDKLAAEGTLFVNGYSSAPSSTPGRAGLLTGLSPWHHGTV